jgi:hypothetical protein
LELSNGWVMLLSNNFGESQRVLMSSLDGGVMSAHGGQEPRHQDAICSAMALPGIEKHCGDIQTPRQGATIAVSNPAVG